MRRIALAVLLAAPCGAAWPARAASHGVTISGFAFSPATVTVAQGDSVTWTMADPPPTNHTVTSDDGHSFSSSYLATGETFSHTFNAPGTFAYHCAIHSSMQGTVVVTAASSTTTSNSTTTTAKPTTTTARPTTSTTARATTTTSSTASTTSTTVAALATTTTSETATTTSTSEAAASTSKRGGSNNGPKVVALLLAIAGLGAGSFAVARRLRAAP